MEAGSDFGPCAAVKKEDSEEGMRSDGTERTAHKTRSGERTLEIACSWFVEDVDGDGLGVKKTFETHESLDKKGLGEFEVAMHDGHHGDTKVG